MKKIIITLLVLMLNVCAFAQVGRHSLHLKNYITVGLLEYEYIALQSHRYQLSASIGVGGYVRRLFPKDTEGYNKPQELPTAKIWVPALYASLSAHIRLHKDNYLSTGLFFNYRNEANAYGLGGQSYEYLRISGNTRGFRLAYAHRPAKGLQWSVGITPFGVTTFKPSHLTAPHFLGFLIYKYVPQHLLEYKGRRESYLQDNEKFYNAVSGNPPRIINNWTFIFPYPEFSIGWRF